MDVVYILPSDSDGEKSSDIDIGGEIEFANVEGLMDLRMERPRSHANQDVSRFGRNTGAGLRDHCQLGNNKRPEPDQAFREAFRTLVLVALLVVPRKQCSIGRLALMDLLRKNFGQFPIVTDKKLSDAIDWNLAYGTLAVVLRCRSGICSNDRYRCERHPAPTVANAADRMRNVVNTPQYKAVVVRRAVHAVAAALQDEKGPLDVFDVVAYLTEVNPKFNIDWEDMDICLDGMMEEGLITGELLDGNARLIQLREDVDMPDASSELLVQSFRVLAQYYERHGWTRWFGPDNAPPPANKSRWLASSVPASSLTRSEVVAQERGRPQTTGTPGTSRHPVPHPVKPMPSPAGPSTLPVFMDRSPATRGPGPSVPVLAQNGNLLGQAANPQPTFSFPRGQQPAVANPGQVANAPFMGGIQSAVLDPALQVPTYSFLGAPQPPVGGYGQMANPLFMGDPQPSVPDPGQVPIMSFLEAPQPPAPGYRHMGNPPFRGEPQPAVPDFGKVANIPFPSGPQPPALGNGRRFSGSVLGPLQHLTGMQGGRPMASPSGQGEAQGGFQTGLPGGPPGVQRLAQLGVAGVKHARPPPGEMGRESGPSHDCMQYGASSYQGLNNPMHIEASTSHAYQGQNNPMQIGASTSHAYHGQNNRMQYEASTSYASQPQNNRMQHGASTSRALQGQNNRTPLHHEIMTFAERTTSAPGGAQAARQACDRLRKLVVSIWPHAEMHLFGSQATGLALPGSDLDVVVLGVSPVLRNAAQGFTSQEKQVVTSHLNTLLRRMRSSGLVERAFLIGRAKVPIIKAHIRGPGNMQVDVSMGVMNGITAVSFVSRQISAMPPLRALVLVLKALLRDAGMNEVHTGGLSSYSTTLMAMAYLMQEGYPLARANPVNSHVLPNGAKQDLGQLLIGFLDRFVRRFNYANEAVSVDYGGFRTKPSAWKESGPGKREALAIEDPQEPGRDIAGGSHRIADVRDLFRAALECLEDGLANYSRIGGSNGSAAEAWARIQEDGASRSVVPPQMPLLGKLFSIQEALSPSAPKPLQDSGLMSPGAPRRKEKRAKMSATSSTSSKKKKRKAGPRLPRALEVGAPVGSPLPKRRRQG